VRRPWSVATSTPLHCEILARAASHADGARIRGAGPNTAAHTLQAAGLGRFAETSPGGHFLINAAGRAILREALVHADAEACRYLGNANEESARGRADKGRALMAKCQAWLDAANMLRRDGDDAALVREGA
jgi:hypothetical protein